MITIARLTIGEAARRRILWVLIGLALVAVGVTGWGVDRLVTSARASGAPELTVQIGVSQILIFIAFQFGFVRARTAAFLGSPAIATDIESGVALALLARPLRRTSYLLGRWLGLAVVLAAYGAGSSFLAILVVGQVSGYTPPSILTPIVFLVAEGLVILTLSLLLSTRLPPIGAGATAVVAFGLAWAAGAIERLGHVMAGENADLNLEIVGRIGNALLPTDGLWRGVIYGLEPPFVILAAQGQPLARGNPFFADTPPSPVFLAWAVVWVVLVLVVAAISLRRREL